MSGLEGIYQTCKVLAEHTGETELVPMIKSILAENEALRTKLARFKKWNSQLTAKCNWYNCDGARLEREIEALKAELKAINTALDDPRTDLTMTACEVIVALKEQVVQLKTVNGQMQFEQQHQRSNGYWRCKHAGRWQYRHRVVWELHNGPIPDGFMVDHINAVRGDDRIGNLQLVTNQENTRLGSHQLKPSNTTGSNCVNLNHCGRWYGQFRHGGKRVYCGTHATREQAEQSVIQRRIELNAPTRRVACQGA